MKEKNPHPYNVGSIICGIWFILTGSIWVYFGSLVISYPVALIGLLLWNKGRKIEPNNKLNKTALILHIIGLTLSMLSLIILLISN